jgi:DNA transposition AAA+ family ATPase
MSQTAESFDATATYDPSTEGAELRALVKDYVLTNSTSYKSVAVLAGVGESTFTAWLSNKYRGNNDKINERVRTWYESQTMLGRNKVAMPEVAYAATRTAAKCLATLEYAQSMADIVVISGGAGVGKTTACMRHKEIHPNVWMLTADPSLASPYAVLEYLRETLGIPDTAPYKVSRAIAARIAGTRGLIIIDEAQHLSVKAIDQLRAVHDRAHVGMALVGNEEVWGRIDGGGRKTEFAQLFSRVGKRVTVARPSTRDIEALLDASEIVDDEQRKMLKAIAQKPGALRGMAKTLRQARMVALGAQEELSEQHIRQAWSSFLGDGGEGTP